MQTVYRGLKAHFEDLRHFDTPHQSCIQAGHWSRFPFHKAAGFDALNFDHHWPVFTDRRVGEEVKAYFIKQAHLEN